MALVVEVGKPYVEQIRDVLMIVQFLLLVRDIYANYICIL